MSKITAKSMVTLYHGSLEIVRNPEIRVPNRKLDFGQGFYLTSSEKQATDWVLRKLDDKDINKGYVNVYNFDLARAEKALRIKVFDSPSDEWIDFVMANRLKQDSDHDYDIVIGPVANDRVYTAFTLYEGGIIDKETLKHDLKTYKLVDQYLCHTAQALEYLEFVSSKEVRL
jgi:hypothetical protein